MRVLLTNDDGIHAPGLKVLEKIARSLSEDIWIVAPENDNSGASHSLTLSDPLRIREVSNRHYAVKGTPTDCVIMALRHLMVDDWPDLVLSGVNRGQNIADDVSYSGTIAGAMEGALLGVRSIALSQGYGFETGRSNMHWDTAEAHGPRIVQGILNQDLPSSSVINVNFPDCAPNAVAGTRITRQGKRDQDTLKIDARIDGRGNNYYWLGFQKKLQSPAENTDLWAMENKFVSITPLSLDMTDNQLVNSMSEISMGTP